MGHSGGCGFSLSQCLLCLAPSGARREGNWLRGGIDVDLEASPVTNIFPIRRMVLANGASRETRSAWVRVPSLDVEPAVQTYKRLSQDDYEYSDRPGTFPRRVAGGRPWFAGDVRLSLEPRLFLDGALLSVKRTPFAGHRMGDASYIFVRASHSLNG